MNPYAPSQYQGEPAKQVSWPNVFLTIYNCVAYLMIGVALGTIFHNEVVAWVEWAGKRIWEALP